MAYPNRFKPLLKFDDVSDGINGVIWKAGCQNAADDANGIGVNGTLTDVGGDVDFSEGGISTSVATTSTTVAITVPPANQEGLQGQGRIQFDIKKSALVGMINQGLAILGLYDAANSDANGPRVLFNGSTAQFIDDSTANFISKYVNQLSYGVLQLDSTWATQKFEAVDSQAAICIASGDEWVTLTVSWTPTEITWLQDGHTITRSGHAQAVADLTYLKLELRSTVLADRLPIRNIILCDHPAPDTHKYLGHNIPKVICMGHSFWNSGGGLPEIPFDTIERCGSIDHLTTNIHYQYTTRFGLCNFKNLAHDGSVTDVVGVIQGHGESVSPLQKTYDWTDVEVIENRILSGKSDFALLMVHGSNTNAEIAIVDTQLQVILDALIADGTIPIVIREQNRDQGAQDRTDVDAQVVSTVGVYTAANGDNWVGIVDMWTPTGGSTVNTNYVENTGSPQIHPSLDVGGLYGVAVAAEIRRLVIDPPSYSRWSTR